jgi:multidrug efflux pump subunit AcrA (membrane-fusion protein)
MCAHAKERIVATNIDLQQLVVHREGGPPPVHHHRRHVVSRYVLPGLVLVGFLSVLAWAARDSLVHGKPVTVVPVLASRTEIQQVGTPLFRSAGWVEPRPTPVVVTALTEGVVEQLFVVEGQEVKPGQTIAHLIDSEAKLALQAAEADVKLRRAELAAARAAALAADTNLKYPVQLEASVAEADAMLAKMETELGILPKQLQGAEAKEEATRFTLERKRAAYSAKGVPEIEYQQAQSDWKAATASVEELKAREPRIKRELGALTRKRDALAKRLELKADEIRMAAEGAANLQSAEARLRQAEVAVASAKLRLERMTVKATVPGRVLALVARPGTRLMGVAVGTLQESSTVITQYDPEHLQVRADVRLEDVPRLQQGQPVLIETPAISTPIDGKMLFATSQADIQKNTLQVKVSIDSPPPAIKPDMLVQVTFLAPERPAGAATPSEELRLYVPRSLVESGDGGTHVWVGDQIAGKASIKSIRLGQATQGNLVEVVDGLTPADKLISGGREGLTNGQRIVITEDSAPVDLPTREQHGKPARRPQ